MLHLAETSHITICPRFMERINLEELANPFISINTIDRLDSVMGLIIACVGIGVRVKIFVRI